MEILLNPLSANQQCHSVEDCYDVVNFYIECCDFCLSALDSGRVKLLLDENIEQRHLIEGQNFRATISQLKGFTVDGFRVGKDAMDKWYLYSRNRSTPLSGIDGIAVTQTADNPHISLEGVVCKHAHDEVNYWLSFPKHSVCEANGLTLKSEFSTRSIKNAANLNSFKAWLPTYEPNPKHRDKPYTAAGGEQVSPMPLCNVEAQTLLLTSLPENSGTRWAFHKRTGAFYCFRKTYPNQEVFHGYLDEVGNVPNDLRGVLRH
jgi:hypothetical protein